MNRPSPRRLIGNLEGLQRGFASHQEGISKGSIFYNGRCLKLTHPRSQAAFPS
ncbi:unnamed protein product, partial [Musa hybrid cultivar]